MIPTPRTDAEAYDVGGYQHDQGSIVTSAFARQLERELATARASLRKTLDAADALRDRLYRQMLYEGDLTTRNTHRNAIAASAMAFQFDADLTAARDLLATSKP